MLVLDLLLDKATQFDVRLVLGGHTTEMDVETAASLSAHTVNRPELDVDVIRTGRKSTNNTVSA